MKNRATVGEVSYALEEVFGRFEGKPAISKNIYASHFDELEKLEDLKDDINKFKEINKKPPKILVCKLGQDGTIGERK